MSFEEFKSKVEEIVLKSDDQHQYVRMGYDESRWSGGWEPVSKYSWEKKEYSKYKDVLQAEWYTGGMSGGNCWNDNEPRYESSGNKPEELVLLDEILEQFNPNINFLQYKNLCSSIMSHNTRSQGEYYGNTSEYASVSVDLDQLYTYMKSKGWLEKQ
jgi:hypothetical protein